MTPASLPHPKGKGWEDRSGGLSPLPPSPAPSSTISLWLREGGPIAPIPVSLSLDRSHVEILNLITSAKTLPPPSKVTFTGSGG